ncbi:hypothetical protein [Paraflavitalea sp. CAU 1676]|uniref:hypothetical protein n=1 Tax=Paraflavitalea sp. CAU 1676 TaxID=3032598 RepID=UPI0023D98E9D|nr:hypothetical protein [Paraflavitalea sp. CAU 1676]MDF2190554.1 hypothetical protein [Paraflavitalea sp. CAU 1676]
MPTKKQLYSIWATQFEYFGGFGQPQANYIGASDGSHEGHGLSSERIANKPLVPQSIVHEFSGLHIGEINFNVESDDLRIWINQE